MNDMAHQDHGQLYFQFLKLSQSVQNNDQGQGLSPTETDLLKEVVLRDFEGRAFSVSEALALKNLGSPATLHKRLQRLREAGLLSFTKEITDKRTKYLIATPLAIQYFERMGDAMQKAMHG